MENKEDEGIQTSGDKEKGKDKEVERETGPGSDKEVDSEGNKE